MSKSAPTSLDDVIDSRDIIQRIEDLEGEESRTEEEEAELATLIALQNEAKGYVSDWMYGATLIRDDYFETYAQEFADDIGRTKDNEEWPYTHIDWKAAAEDLKQDYTCVTFDGVEYWVR